MTKKLRRRFVFAGMAAVSILLVVVLGTLNIVSAVLSQRKLEDTARALAQRAMAIEQQLPYEQTRETDSAVYLSVLKDGTGKVLRVDSSRINYLSNNAAFTLFHQAEATGKEEGTLDFYQFARLSSANQELSALVLLDKRPQQAVQLQVLGVSLLLGLFCSLGMLLLLILLSKRAMAPIAENMEQQKRFVTDAGHELKTPIAIILTNLEAMELLNGENKWSRNIYSQALRLRDMTQNLLTLTKAQALEKPLLQEDVALSDILQELAQDFTESALQKDVTVHLDIQPQVHLQGNRDMLWRLVSILLDNGVKYSTPAGEIWLQLQKKNRKITLRCANSYQMDEAFQPQRLFDRFYREDKARTQSSGGFGIGLSAAQAIVSSHGGTIEAVREKQDVLAFLVEF